jgi:hypothetical protein
MFGRRRPTIIGAPMERKEPEQSGFKLRTLPQLIVCVGILAIFPLDETMNAQPIEPRRKHCLSSALLLCIVGRFLNARRQSVQQSMVRGFRQDHPDNLHG